MSTLIIKTGMKLNKFKQWLFALVALDSTKMFWFWFSVLVFEQLISVAIEYAVWGHRFTHIGDVIATGLVFCLYLHYQGELGKFLLRLTLSNDKELE